LQLFFRQCHVDIPPIEDGGFVGLGLSLRYRYEPQSQSQLGAQFDMQVEWLYALDLHSGFDIVVWK
jgi:hypothetical protein